jgi:flavin-dependent dehydrogenase
MDFDVVIIGAGPAGSTCAFALAQKGYKVCLIDKCTFPRTKTCAGILTTKTLQLWQQLGITLPPDIGAFKTSVDIYLENDYTCSFSTLSNFFIVERVLLDAFLLNRASESGAQILEGVQGITFKFEQNQLHFSGNSISYKYLIAADGVWSKTAKALNLPAITKGFCIQTDIAIAETIETFAKQDTMYFFTSSFHPGYSWVLPRKTSVTVGTGGLLTDISGQSIKKTPYPNIAFIGDAAGFSFPITGEGIYHAVLSATLAAKSILSLKSGASFKEEYSRNTISICDQVKEDSLLLDTYYAGSIVRQLFLQSYGNEDYLAVLVDNLISKYNRSYKSVAIELNQLFR